MYTPTSIIVVWHVDAQSNLGSYCKLPIVTIKHSGSWHMLAHNINIYNAISLKHECLSKNIVDKNFIISNASLLVIRTASKRVYVFNCPKLAKICSSWYIHIVIQPCESFSHLYVVSGQSHKYYLNLIYYCKKAIHLFCRLLFKLYVLVG